MRSLTQDYLNHTEKLNLQELQEYLEERLQRRLTAEDTFVDNVLKESLYQESNVIAALMKSLLIAKWIVVVLEALVWIVSIPQRMLHLRKKAKRFKPLL